MKIISNSEFQIPNSKSGTRHSPFAIRHSERGMATFILIALLAIMVVLVMAESSALYHLHRELQLLQQRQIQRLDASQPHSIATTRVEPK
ncbi:MAG TPA: hypothetical protein VFY06_15860 [Verrucomicrobiae bacterium]|nr:hypothetical protein [Verrucomicrobiae bacterium]